MVSTCVLPALGVKSKRKYLSYFVGTQSSSRDVSTSCAHWTESHSPWRRGQGGSPGESQPLAEQICGPGGVSGRDVPERTPWPQPVVGNSFWKSRSPQGDGDRRQLYGMSGFRMVGSTTGTEGGPSLRAACPTGSGLGGC